MNPVIATDRLEDTVDRLADTVEEILTGPPDLICSLEFAEAEALAEVLAAGSHRDIAARFMHRWALTEPDWADEHGDVIRHWLAIDVGAAPALVSRAS